MNLSKEEKNLLIESIRLSLDECEGGERNYISSIRKIYEARRVKLHKLWERLEKEKTTD